MSLVTSWRGENPLTISNSEIQTWKDCRRRWYLTYYKELGLKREQGTVFGARELGTKVHIVLDGLYKDGLDPIALLDELYAEDREILAGDELGLISLAKEQDLAHAMIEGYIQWIEEEGIDAGLELVDVEKVVQVKSGVGGVFLRGKLDQRWKRKSDGARLFRDFKTVVEFATPNKILVMDEQMKFYHLLEFIAAMDEAVDKSVEPERTDGALYTMLRKVKRTGTAKPPFFMELEVHHNTMELRNMWQRVQKVIEEIVTARQLIEPLEAAFEHEPIPGTPEPHQYVFPPRPSRDCTWKCDFFAVCPLMDDGSNYQGLLTERYEHVDPHERYAAQDAGKEVTE